MIDITGLSRNYDVRRLTESDIDAILQICQDNSQFYLYCQARPVREEICNDMHITPPGVDFSAKYYIGFFQEDELIAVMDLIDGYPEKEIAFIGFFMMKKEWQGQEIGTRIISDVAAYLKQIGKAALHLGIDKENPQSNHFWKKNGFSIIREVDRDGWKILYAERKL